MKTKENQIIWEESFVQQGRILTERREINTTNKEIKDLALKKKVTMQCEK